MDLSRAKPGMRRKSSASNLLASLKPGAASSSSSSFVSSPITTTGSTAILSASASAYTYNAASMSSVNTPTSREWDSQSMFSESSNSNANSNAQSNPGSTISPTSSSAAQQGGVMSASADLLRDMVAKRMKTFSFLKSVHEGRGHWLQSIQFSRAELDNAFDNAKMRKRTYRFHVLGMSLSSLWEIAAPHDFLRGLLDLLTEFDDQFPDDNYKPKMRNLFKASKAPRRTGAADAPMPYSDFFTEGSLLLTPSIPFALDYSQTLYSLYDILLETYHKIYRLLGPSILPSSHAPSQSYRSGQPSTTRSRSYSARDREREDDGVGISIITPLPDMGELAPGAGNGSPVESLSSMATQQQQARHAQHGNGLGLSYSVGLPPMPESPPPWTPQLGETILSIDRRIKKVWVPIVKEMDTLARELIKQELAFLSLGGDGINGWVDVEGQG